MVAAGCQPGGLPRRVDAPHLHPDRRQTTDAQHQDDRQRGNGERRLDGDATLLTT